MKNKLCIVVCHNHAPEVRAALKAEGIEDAAVAVFSGKCIRPGNAWDKAIAAAASCGEDATGIVFLGGYCLSGTNELPAQLRRDYVVKADRCFDMIAGKETVDRYLQEGAYLMSPGWLTGWKHYIEEWGFDQQTAREFFGESIKKFILLDTGVYPKSEDHLREFAAFAGLPHESVTVGLDFLRLFLSRTVFEWRLARQAASQTDMQKKLADYAMTLDVMGAIAATMSEIKVVDDIFDIFTMLFAPARLLYLPIAGAQSGKIISRPQLPVGDDTAKSRLCGLSGDHAWTESGNGFHVRIDNKGETLGIIEAEGFLFPEYKDHYVSLSLTIAKIAGLAIFNARTYGQLRTAKERLEETNRELDQRFHEIKTLRGMLPICSYCKKIRDDKGSWQQMEMYVRDHSEAEFSHGMCPVCEEKAIKEVDDMKKRKNSS